MSRSEASEAGRFEVRFPVRFHDVDRAGIVFFAKLLEYCHVAFEELLTALGYPPDRFYGTEGLGAPFVRVSSDFTAPLRHGDTLVIRVYVARIGRSSLHMRYRIFNQHGAPCTRVDTTQVFVGIDTLASRPIPRELRERLERLRSGADGETAGEP